MCESFMSPGCLELSFGPLASEPLGPASWCQMPPSPPPAGWASCPWLQSALPEVGQLGQAGAPHVLSPCQPWELHTGHRCPLLHPLRHLLLSRRLGQLPLQPLFPCSWGVLRLPQAASPRFSLLTPWPAPPFCPRLARRSGKPQHVGRTVFVALTSSGARAHRAAGCGEKGGHPRMSVPPGRGWGRSSLPVVGIPVTVETADVNQAKQRAVGWTGKRRAQTPSCFCPSRCSRAGPTKQRVNPQI